MNTIVTRPKRMGPIAREIEGVIANLLDPRTKWVKGDPRHPGESCAVYRYNPAGDTSEQIISVDTEIWLDDFVADATYADDEDDPAWGLLESGYPLHSSITGFNDDAENRQQVWLMLEEALDQAIADRV